VDLYCEAGELVVAVESGVVIACEPFTGPQADSPWWNNTHALVVRNGWWTVVYGELDAAGLPTVGTTIDAGQTLGAVARVLQHDKGRPTSMLHFEMYDSSFVSPVWWKLGEPKPAGLLNPTDLLLTAHVRRLTSGIR
jgi:murein DD-endopeptidase MepM/ murein hydrolase activator NlpD